MGLVRVRLVADTPEELDAAITTLAAALGDRVRLDRPARRGREGDWLAYGTLGTRGTPDGATDTPPDAEGAGSVRGVGSGWTR